MDKYILDKALKKIFRIVEEVEDLAVKAKVYKSLFNSDIKRSRVAFEDIIFFDCIELTGKKAIYVAMRALDKNGDSVMEFPDDQSALLWFNLEY